VVLVAISEPLNRGTLGEQFCDSAEWRYAQQQMTAD
jgi:hypothetical protein